MNLFDEQPRVTAADRKRLSPLLTGWSKLSPALKGMTDDDIKRCVVMEATTTKRQLILERLLGRYNKNSRKRILTLIQNAPQNP